MSQLSQATAATQIQKIVRARQVRHNPVLLKKRFDRINPAFSLDGQRFYTVPKLWKASETMESSSVSCTRLFEQHKTFSPWGPASKLESLVPRLKAVVLKVLEKKDWASLDYEQDIKPTFPWINEQEERQLARHIGLILKADLSYAILINPEGKVMDGNHRMVQALVRGLETIEAKQFDKMPKEDLYLSSIQWQILRSSFRK